MQTSLTGEGPKILDSTCSFSKIWPKHATIRIDIRPETNPDIVMDAKDLKFPNDYFDEIYCDPPHLMAKEVPQRIKQFRRLSGRRSPDPWTRYGFWKTKEEWFEFIEKTNNEFYRCLKKDGKLFYKLTKAAQCTKYEDLIERMTNFTCIKIDEQKQVKSNFGKGKQVWLTFIPKSTL